MWMVPEPAHLPVYGFKQGHLHKSRPTVNIEDSCDGSDVTVLRIFKYGVRGVEIKWKGVDSRVRTVW